MPKITIVGAGGWVFPSLLCRDLLAFESLRESEFALFDISAEGAQRTLTGVQALIDAFRLGATAYATTNRRKALEGADVVICAFQVGGVEAYSHDVEIPRRYGIDQPVGDTLGPGGVFRGLRSIGALSEICADMREVCPAALLIQYANPMSMNCWATERMGVRTVGLCHSVQHTSAMLAGEIEVPYDDVIYDCAGINHTAWFTTFRRRSTGEDLTGRIRDVMAAKHIYAVSAGEESDELHGGGSERVRSSIMELTGYFHTESSHHASEYWAWFRKTPDDIAEYIRKRWDYFQICSTMHETDRGDEFVRSAKERGLVASQEYGAYIVDSMTTGTPRVIYGNVSNAGGSITNLPLDANVELACLVDANGVRPVHYGALPASCAALNISQINIQRLAVEAGLTGDRSLVHTAVALDPLTSATLTLPAIRAMVDEMFAATKPWLPQFS